MDQSQLKIVSVDRKRAAPKFGVTVRFYSKLSRHRHVKEIRVNRLTLKAIVRKLVQEGQGDRELYGEDIVVYHWFVSSY